MPDEIARKAPQAPSTDKARAAAPVWFKTQLMQRVGSSLVLAPPTLAATIAGGWPFALVVGVMALVMVFEWARMTARAHYQILFYGLAIGVLAATALSLHGAFLAAGASTLATALGVFAAGQITGRRSLPAALGAVYIIAPCVALMWLRNGHASGLALTMTIFICVWFADIGAYFAGRFIGGRRISRRLSPEKTWMGVAGGVLWGAVGGVLAAGLFFPDDPMASLAGLGALLGFSSVLGDLAESAMKRHFGVKDSGNFIPGHGGFLDRLDGMIFATTAMTTALLAPMIAEHIGG